MTSLGCRQSALDSPAALQSFAQGRRVYVQVPRPFRQRLRYAVEGEAFGVVAIASSVWRNSQCFVQRPAQAQPLAQSGRRDTCAVRPLGQSQCLVVESKFGVPSGVSHLRGRQGPHAIARFVWSVVVDTFNRMVGRRTSAHVSMECLETSAPRLTHSDTARAVSFEALRLWVVASVLGGLPDLILGSLRKAVCADRLNALASTARRVSVAQRRRPNANAPSTVAEAIPCAFVSDVAVQSHGNESPEAVSREIDRLHLIRVYAGFSRAAVAA